MIIVNRCDADASEQSLLYIPFYPFHFEQIEKCETALWYHTCHLALFLGNPFSRLYFLNISVCKNIYMKPKIALYFRKHSFHSLCSHKTAVRIHCLTQRKSISVIFKFFEDSPLSYSLHQLINSESKIIGKVVTLRYDKILYLHGRGNVTVRKSGKSLQ